MAAHREALHDFLQSVCQIEGSIDSEALLLEELGLESVSFFELLFFIKSRTEVSLDNNQLFTILFASIIENENMNLTPEEAHKILQTIETLDFSRAEIIRKMRFSHVLSMIENLEQNKEACVPKALDFIKSYLH